MKEQGKKQKKQHFSKVKVKKSAKALKKIIKSYKGQILLLSGPSGSGKSTLLSRLLKEEKDLYFSISSTTRTPREGEKHGINYYFTSKDKFKQDIKDGNFLEWAYVHKNYYGTPLKPIIQAFAEGKIAIFDIDVQGFEIARRKFPRIITSVFVTTANKNILKTRLQNRKTDSEQSIENRLINAAVEMKCLKEYDYLLINDDLEKSYDALKSILKTMRLKTSKINLRKSLDRWINC
ncbi:MAG: guanylate kinase [Campylobacter sp.]|nr:guanylate kinase [Campylobacter sp.]